ncbi:methylmalonyl-CoA epimerase [candidate division WOR-3 bacterium]|nr:methylmalonyl-CoA epimerase [candidate division WOR-3 bacterium]
MNMKLDHIAIAVKSIEERLKIWQYVLNLKLEFIKDVPDQKVKVAVLDINGLHIELLEPLEETSTISKFIEKKGEGLHHLCFEVENIESMLLNMKKQGIKLIDEVPKIGASGKKIAFIHPKDMGGVLIELSQK